MARMSTPKGNMSLATANDNEEEGDFYVDVDSLQVIEKTRYK